MCVERYAKRSSNWPVDGQSPSQGANSLRKELCYAIPDNPKHKTRDTRHKMQTQTQTRNTHHYSKTKHQNAEMDKTQIQSDRKRDETKEISRKNSGDVVGDESTRYMEGKGAAIRMSGILYKAPKRRDGK